jgi:predicted DNA-binding transcriptional regulator YafY
MHGTQFARQYLPPSGSICRTLHRAVRASRLLSIQMLLQTRGRMSARALAGALEVSARTLYRDVDQLAAAGVPIYAERGRSGGFQLLEGWKTTLTGLTPSEAQAVFLSGLAGPAAQLGLGAQVETAKLKLLAALPAPWRNDAQRISSRLHLDPVDWYRQAEPVPHLATVAAAVWNERQLAIRYESWKAMARRTVNPLGLVLKAGAWYLVAAVGDAPRTYRISNIGEVQPLEERCRRPRKFDLARYWAESIRRFESELYKSQAVVLATPAGLKALRYLSSAVARAVVDAPAPPGKDGRAKVSIPIESIEHATAQLLTLSPQVEVIAPAALRRSLVARLHRSCQLYGVQTEPPAA